MLLAKPVSRGLAFAILFLLACSSDKSTSPPPDDFHGFRYLGQYQTHDRATGVIVDGDFAYVAEHDSGMGVVDVSDPTHPVLTGRYRCPGALQIDLKGSTAYIADESLYSLEIVSISNPSNPSLVGRLDTMEVLGVRVFGNYAVMGCGHDGLQVVDIRDPANPTLTGSCEELGVLRFEIVGSHALVPGDYGYEGLFVVDLSDPTEPSVIGGVSVGGSPYEVAVAGNYAYMTDLGDPFTTADTGYLHIVDLSETASPQKIDSLFLGLATIADYIAGDYLYVTFVSPDTTTGFCILDISNPVDPAMVRTQSLGAVPWDIWVEQGYIYIAADTEGLLIYEFRP